MLVLPVSSDIEVNVDDVESSTSLPPEDNLGKHGSARTQAKVPDHMTITSNRTKNLERSRHVLQRDTYLSLVTS